MIEIFRDEFINNTSEKLVREFIDEYAMALANLPENEFYGIGILTSELKKMRFINAVESDFCSGNVDMQGVQRRFLQNKFYDDINMGQDNLIISTFQHLFFRDPTKAELIEGKKLLNFSSGYLLNKNGCSVNDLYNILFNSDAYREGQVRFWFKYLLNRNPNIDEVVKYMWLEEDFDIKKLQIHILSDYL